MTNDLQVSSRTTMHTRWPRNVTKDKESLAEDLHWR